MFVFSDCVALQDPYCAWQDVDKACMATSQG